MEKIVNLRIEKLPEGAELATSEDLPGLVVQGDSIAETLESARDVARQLIEVQQEWARDAGARFPFPAVPATCRKAPCERS